MLSIITILFSLCMVSDVLLQFMLLEDSKLFYLSILLLIFNIISLF